MKLNAYVLLMVTCVAASAPAEINYYNDTMPGGRALAMGGAYAAIADDASGLYYNPAGLTDGARQSDSDSSTFYYTKRLTARAVFGDQDVHLDRRAISTFLGVKKHLADDLMGAFAVYVPLAESQSESFDFGAQPETGIMNLNEVSKGEDNLVYITGGLAHRTSADTSWGVSLSAVRGYSNTVTGLGAEIQAGHLGNSTPFIIDIHNGSLREFEFYNYEAAAGVKKDLSPNLYLGVCVTAGDILYAREAQVEEGLTTYIHADGTPVGAGEIKGDDPHELVRNDHEEDSDTWRRGMWKRVLRAGVAWEKPRDVALSFDVEHHFAVSSPIRESRAITNAMAGVEWWGSPFWAWRGGLFSNRDSNLPLGDPNVYSNVNLYGATLQASYHYRGSEYALAVTGQAGKGLAATVGNSTERPIQDASTRSMGAILTVGEAL